MKNRKDYFNASAVTWDQRYQNRALADFIGQLVPTFNLKPGQRVLDVGTGTGILIPYLLKAVGSTGHVTAVDYAEKMVEICKAKYANIPNVSVALQQAENLDFYPESFDAVTCFGLFPHLEDKEAALKQLNRVLKPGGKLIIAHALSSEEIKAHHRNASVVAQDTLPSEAEMRRLLKQAGFIGIKITDEPGCYVCLSTKPQA
ncbi:class I SAM-dependent methyltransferase [Candidatus Bathyarchaeota archaeon A05DMB-2]|nr:class I SAM-dependent methyltransferase [Candidatus Bathyarchaeota archaeon A05DMB-2]